MRLSLAIPAAIVVLTLVGAWAYGEVVGTLVGLWFGFMAALAFVSLRKSEDAPAHQPVPRSRNPRRGRGTTVATPGTTVDNEAKLGAHDDYMAATRTMAHRQWEMSPRAQRGDEFARGWVAAMHEFSLAVQKALAIRLDLEGDGYPADPAPRNVGGVEIVSGLMPKAGPSPKSTNPREGGGA